MLLIFLKPVRDALDTDPYPQRAAPSRKAREQYTRPRKLLPEKVSRSRTDVAVSVKHTWSANDHAIPKRGFGYRKSGSSHHTVTCRRQDCSSTRSRSHNLLRTKDHTYISRPCERVSADARTKSNQAVNMIPANCVHRVVTPAQLLGNAD